MRAIVAIGFAVFAAGALPPLAIPSAKSQPSDQHGLPHPRQGTQTTPITDCDRYVKSGKAYDNPDLAIQACESAVREYPNSIRLIYQLGRAYDSKKDFRSALVQYRKAAAQGYADAQFALGFMYDKGRGVPQNYGEALKWYRKAAEQGDIVAQYFLAEKYFMGEGAPQDYGEASKWCRKLAEQGHAHSQFNLALMYSTGLGVRQDYVQAHMWVNLALAGPQLEAMPNIRDKAIKHRDSFTSLMSPAQIAEAHRLARICLQNNYKECGVDRPRIARRDEGTPPPVKREVTATGTGFFVSEGGHIVTNAHVVEHCFTVRSSLGGPISKVSVDEQSDLALYLASEKPKAFARLRGGRGARAGEPVTAVGFPLSGLLSSDPIVTTGIISALSGLRNDRRTIQITAAVQPGNSGGPLLGDNGSVVGVVVGKLNAMKVAQVIGDIPQNVNFAVSLGTLQSFLNANDVPYALDDNNATKSPADITAEASHYTVLLECLR